MSTNHAVRRPGRAARSRMFGAGAVVAACAVVGALTAGGNALASSVASHPAASHPAAPHSAATSTAIKACYQKNVSLPAVKHIAASATCPSGYSSLTWNQQGPAGPKGPTGPTGKTGPQGPAGLSVGVSVTAPTPIVLDHTEDLTPVMAAEAVPQGGSYFVSASVMLRINTGDTVACILGQGGAYQDEFATIGPVSGQSYETIPLTGLMLLSAGQQPTVYCTDYTSDSTTEFYDGAMTATLMNSVSGDTTRQGPVSRQDLHLPPLLKHS